MADKRFRGRDKIVQKMTKDGLVEENIRTGETKSAVSEEPPKQEDSEKDTAESVEEIPVTEEDVCMDAEDEEEEKPRQHSTAKQSAEYYKAHQEDGKQKETPPEGDAEPAPKKKGRLSFDDEQQGGIVRGAGMGIKKVAKKGVDTATGFAHNKVHQVEKENSGVESAHKTEETVEELYRFSKGRKKTKEKSARAEKKVEAEKKSSRLKFSEEEGSAAEESAEMPLKKKQPQPNPTAAGGEAKTVGSKFYQKKQYKEQQKTIFDDEQRNLIVNFAYKLDDRAETENLVNNLAAALSDENQKEVNRLMWEAEEKIENLPDGMIGLSEMHEYGYLKDDVLPLTKEGAREWHRLGERIYPLFRDGTAGDFASQEEIEQHDGIFGIKADAWSAILLEKNEEYLEDEYGRKHEKGTGRGSALCCRRYGSQAVGGTGDFQNGESDG